jgi:hypothetical protein
MTDQTERRWRGIRSSKTQNVKSQAVLCCSAITSCGALPPLKHAQEAHERARDECSTTCLMNDGVPSRTNALQCLSEVLPEPGKLKRREITSDMRLASLGTVRIVADNDPPGIPRPGGSLYRQEAKDREIQTVLADRVGDLLRERNDR